MKVYLSSVKRVLAVFALCVVPLCVLAQGPDVERNAVDNTITTVSFPGGNRPSVDITDEVVHQYTELDNHHELKLKFSNKQKNGLTISRYAQWYRGIAVEHGSISVLGKDNEITFINAHVFRPGQLLSTVPVLSGAEALQKALGNIKADEYMWESVPPKEFIQDKHMFEYPVATMVWVEDFTHHERDKQLHLAYKFDIYAKKPLSRDLVYVDAVTGKILLKDAVIKHTAGTGTSVYSGTVGFDVALASPGVYKLYDSLRKVATYDIGGGTSLGFAVLVNSNSATFPKSVGVDAHWGATKVYDYWLNEHGRLSYDNSGAAIQSIVNYDIGLNNAHWNGSTLLYGSGTGMLDNGINPSVSLDICAHEIGHGVCAATSALIYEKESGAINEGLSDIWGAVIEHYTAPEKQMWVIGEEIHRSGLRNMRTPKVFGHPDCYEGTNWIDTAGCTPEFTNDYCGIHTNSSVLNHWFYLLTAGGRGSNDKSNYYEVNGIGVKKAADVVYATEQVLTASANFAECRTVSIAAATSLYGACSREAEAVTRAWYAVGVGTEHIPCAPQIGFATGDTTISRVVPGMICPSSKTVTIPVRITGNAPAGGNAVVNFAGTGSAVDGVDYTILNNPLTFNAGSTATQNIQVKIPDNGDVKGDKVLKLFFTITRNGSDASVSYTYDTCIINITGSRGVPDTAGDVHSLVNTPDVKSKAVTPFFSRYELARTQFIIQAEELHTAGVRANEPITAMEFYVTEKNSTQPFTNFNLKIAATGVKDISGGNPTVTTVYHNSNLATKQGWNTLHFNTPLVWNGTDNLAIETCFTNTTASTDNDYVEAVVTHKPATSVNYTNAGASGCALLFSSTNYFYSISKPVVRMVQPIQATEAETTLSAARPWEVSPQQSVYFYSNTNGKLMANVTEAPLALGCTDVAITKQGVGLDTIVGLFYKGVMRSKKEFSVISQNNTTKAFPNYEMTFYFDTSELSGVNLATVRVVTTDALTDQKMHGANTEIVVPAISYVSGYIGFKASFQGNSNDGWKGIWGRYFLADNTFALLPWESVESISKNSGNIRVVNNPFTDKIYINYNLPGDSKAEIRLYDITGRVVLSGERRLRADERRFVIQLDEQLLAPGNYVLQVITDTEVMTHKMVKQ